MTKKFYMMIFILLCQCAISCHANVRSQAEIRDFFKDILLIIHFNNPHYGNIEFLEEIYSPYFQNIVFYGEHPHPKVNVISNFYGWYVHRTIKDAMQKWPHFRGYICCQDDCFMNFWNLPRLDKDKNWFHPFATVPLAHPDNHAWCWWNYPCGRAASNIAFLKLPPFAKKNLEDNCGPQTFAFSWADFIYISAKYRKEFMRLSWCFDNPDVFLEIGIPTMMLCMEKDEKMEHINPFWGGWGGIGKSIEIDAYNTQFDWVHPLKFSDPKNREFIKNVISNQVSCQYTN